MESHDLDDILMIGVFVDSPSFLLTRRPRWRMRRGVERHDLLHEVLEHAGSRRISVGQLSFMPPF